MRVMVILNPSADLGHGLRKKELIEREGARWGDLDLVMTEYRGHAQKLAYTAAEDGYDVVVAAGGDGTTNEVVNGLMQVGQNRVKLGIIPIGSGNDFAYALDIPTTILKAVEVIYGGHSRAVDLGAVVDNRGVHQYFENNLGIGFDANVVIRVEAITRLHGFARYLWGVLKTLVLDFRPFQLQMRFDDEKLEHDALFVTFGIGSRHGGGFMLTPDAQVDDNLIDTCTVRPMGRLRALGLLNAAIKGTHIGSPEVTMRQNREIEITCEQPMPIYIDGEIFAQAEDGVHQLKITTVPAAINVLTTPSLSNYTVEVEENL